MAPPTVTALPTPTRPAMRAEHQRSPGHHAEERLRVVRDHAAAHVLAAASWMIVLVVPPSIIRLNAVGRIKRHAEPQRMGMGERDQPQPETGGRGDRRQCQPAFADAAERISADQRADADTGHQRAVACRIAMQQIARESRQQRKIGGAEAGRHRHQHQRGADAFFAEGIAITVRDLAQRMFVHARRPLRNAHQDQAGQHRAEGQRIERKAHALAHDRDQRAGERRADHAREIEHHRIERDGVAQILAPHHVQRHRLARRECRRR